MTTDDAFLLSTFVHHAGLELVQRLGRLLADGLCR